MSDQPADTQAAEEPRERRAVTEPTRIDVSEHGAAREGVPQVMDRRLFMQLLVFECSDRARPSDVAAVLGTALESRGVSGVLYEDVNDPRGLGVLTFSEDPTAFTQRVRSAILDAEPPLRLRPEFTMLGRTYSQGYEHDLEFMLLRRPREVVLNPEWPWAVWYPLRRSGAFARLEPREQAAILREHAIIGRAYGQQDLAHDVRLACHGLDVHDNEFVIGLVGRDLYPLSHVVMSMRRTRQTSEFISQMGPFFVGHATTRIGA